MNGQHENCDTSTQVQTCGESEVNFEAAVRSRHSFIRRSSLQPHNFCNLRRLATSAMPLEVRHAALILLAVASRDLNERTMLHLSISGRRPAQLMDRCIIHAWSSAPTSAARHTNSPTCARRELEHRLRVPKVKNHRRRHPRAFTSRLAPPLISPPTLPNSLPALHNPSNAQTSHRGTSVNVWGHIGNFASRGCRKP